MFGFAIKKSFWIMWDNLGLSVLANLVLIMITALFLYLSSLTVNVALQSFLYFVLSLVLFSCSYIFVLFATQWNNFKTTDFAKVKQTLRESWRGVLTYNVCISLFFPLTSFSFSFYAYQLDNQILAFVGSLFLFWLSFFVILFHIYFYPCLNRLTGTFKEIAKKVALIVLLNPLNSLLLILFLLVLSLLVIPGVMGLVILCDNIVKSYIMKYKYIEENHITNARTKIPWEALLLEENESIGRRTLKGMIFPWKE